MNQPYLDPLHRLARLYRILVFYWDAFGVRRQAPPDTLLAVLRELGAPVESISDVPAAIKERQLARWREFIEPVVIFWEGAPAECVLRVPAEQDAGDLHCELELESGETRTWRKNLPELPLRGSAEVGGARFAARTLPIPMDLPWGYHRLRLKKDSFAADTMIISAPVKAHAVPGDQKKPWGVFLPLYALHSERSWGAGDFTDLRGLADFVTELGGGAVGTLPLLAAFLDWPCDPSPYTPVSRQFWNEFYVDVTAAPEFENSPAAKALVHSSEFAAAIQSFRDSRWVDYKGQMALKRRVIEELAKTLLGKPSERQAAFWRYVGEHPTLESYARFRATVERTQKVWPEWPSRLREGTITEEDFEESARVYHLYAQWLAAEQLTSVADKARQGGLGLYLDLPLGVHRAGFDVWKDPGAFALGVSGGAPPDRFFTKGQTWGFAPSHPENARRLGYRSFVACLRHHLQHAGVLRIDHVMGLHRLYWVPQGLPATEGVYVGYNSGEFYAILNVESQRHQAVIVGEDLGTVPNLVRRNMLDRGLRRMYVAHFEFDSDPQSAIHPPSRNSLACLNTHDVRPFAGFWEGFDIDDQLELGLLTRDEAEAERAKRREIQAAVVKYLRNRGRLGQDPDLAAILRACLSELAASDAEILLVTLEDLWLEELPQNTPGTVDERPNWLRRARQGLEELRSMPEVVKTLKDIDSLRRR